MGKNAQNCNIHILDPNIESIQPYCLKPTLDGIFVVLSDIRGI